MNKLNQNYRVRHPAAPELFVWIAGTKNKDRSFEMPLRREIISLGTLATLTVQFSSHHPGFPKEEAERIAAFVGGTIEPI